MPLWLAYAIHKLMELRDPDVRYAKLVEHYSLNRRKMTDEQRNECRRAMQEAMKETTLWKTINEA